MTQPSRLILLALVLLLCQGAALPAQPPAGYYDSIDDSRKSTLRGTLHERIDDHVGHMYDDSNDTLWKLLEEADEDPGNTANILDVYRNASYPKTSHSGYQREHTWPKSHGFPLYKKDADGNQLPTGVHNYPYTDCHHLFLADSSYNNSRSNIPYGICDPGYVGPQPDSHCTEKVTEERPPGRGGGSGYYPGWSNWRASSSHDRGAMWETWTGRRGDVARAQFYMDVRYEGGMNSLGHREPNLILTDKPGELAPDTTENKREARMGYLSDLILWHLEDPVDDIERRRNDVVYDHQDNRNPFIDHPEWVECLYLDLCNIWHAFFAVDQRETPRVGDFDGDGMTDIITFTRDNPLAVGDVYVSLSDGTKFGNSTKWNDWFAIDSGEKVIIGDYDGDGDDDIATWLGPERALGASYQIYVAASFGGGICQSTLWLDRLGNSVEDRIFAGDVDWDGDDDLILFDRSSSGAFGQVWVARSNGASGFCDESSDPSPGSFSAPEKWHGWFAVSAYERPRVGDVDGDGCTDIITFATDSPTAFGDVFVAVSDCSGQFVDQNGTPNNSTKWHDWFGIDPAELIRVGDFNGDGMDDFFTFLPQTGGQVYVAESQGTSMGPNFLYVDEGFVPGPSERLFVTDVSGDGKADIVNFKQSYGKVRVLVTP